MTTPSFTSILPPVIALVLALTTRNVILSLALGAFGGFVILADYNPLLGLFATLREGAEQLLFDSSHTLLIVLILIIGGFVGLLEQSGGMKSFASRIATWVKGPVRAQLAVWFGGIGIFFSDSATPLILGPIFQPVMARVGISREKLAYIVDSTASPVCVLVPFISWGVYIMSLIDQGYKFLEIEGNGFSTFIRLMPLQFYPVLALLTVPLVIFSKREFGPMAKAIVVDEEIPTTDDGINPRLRTITIPLLVLLGSVAALFCFFWLAYGSISGRQLNVSLIIAYLIATTTAAVVLRQERVLEVKASLRAIVQGVRKMLLIPLILILAWSLGACCQALGTGTYLAQITRRFLTPRLLAPTLFLVGSAISFGMGSAWGTFAILLPMSMRIAHTMGISLLPPIAAVLSGGLFGDHASPISDTTILASMGSGCDHLSHVRTQLPYALMPAVISTIAFYVAGIWQSPWVLALAAFALSVTIYLAMRLLGRSSAATP